MRIAIRPDANHTPTPQIYGQLQSAFDFLNTRLWGAALPPCLLTLQRKGRHIYGFYSHKRFSNGAGVKTDEIALNPRHLKHRPFAEVMSTFAHEMAHLWQAHFGTSSRGGYHNKQWAGEMLRIGLHPSDTGRPGGRMTGQQVTHYIIPDGRFDRVLPDLRREIGPLAWGDDLSDLSLLPTGVENLFVPVFRNGRRVRFTCPSCQCHAWGKGSLNLLCLDCDVAMRPSAPKSSMTTAHTAPPRQPFPNGIDDIRDWVPEEG